MPTNIDTHIRDFKLDLKITFFSNMLFDSLLHFGKFVIVIDIINLWELNEFTIMFDK